MTKQLLTVTAVLEGATGIAMLSLPALVTSRLIGASLDASGALVIARVTGAAMLSLAVACWLARQDGQSRAGRGVVAAMLVYNIAVAAVLMHAGFGLGLSAIGMWPAAVLHSGLAIWCVACLRRA